VYIPLIYNLSLFEQIKWLARSFFIMLIVSFNFNLHSQKLEVFGGINVTHYFDSHKDAPLYNWSSYSSKSKYFIGIGIEDMEMVGQNIRMTLDFHSSEGHAYSRTGTFVYSSDIIVISNKSTLSIGFYPFNYNIFNSFQISVGAVYSYLIRESYKGLTTIFDMEKHIENNLDFKGSNFNSSHYLGLQGRLKYDFTLSERFTIFLQYAYYIGLVDEFNNFPRSTKSMRHNIGLGVNMKI